MSKPTEADFVPLLGTDWNTNCSECKESHRCDPVLYKQARTLPVCKKCGQCNRHCDCWECDRCHEPQQEIGSWFTGDDDVHPELNHGPELFKRHKDKRFCVECYDQIVEQQKGAKPMAAIPSETRTAEAKEVLNNLTNGKKADDVLPLNDDTPDPLTMTDKQFDKHMKRLENRYRIAHIKNYIKDGISLARKSFQEYWCAGRYLNWMKKTIKHGGWLDFLKECNISQPTASRYMALNKRYTIDELKVFGNEYFALDKALGYTTEEEEQEQQPEPTEETPDTIPITPKPSLAKTGKDKKAERAKVRVANQKSKPKKDKPAPGSQKIWYLDIDAMTLAETQAQEMKSYWEVVCSVYFDGPDKGKHLNKDLCFRNEKDGLKALIKALPGRIKYLKEEIDRLKKQKDNEEIKLSDAKEKLEGLK